MSGLYIDTNCNQTSCPKFSTCPKYPTKKSSRTFDTNIDVLFIKSALEYNLAENCGDSSKKNPFCNRRGHLITSLIRYIEEQELGRKTVAQKYKKAYTTIIRGPGNNDACWQYCRKFLERDIEKLKPRLIVTMGAAATSYLLCNRYDKDVFKMHKSSPTKIKFGSREITILPMRDASKAIVDPSIIPDIVEDLRRALGAFPLNPMRGLEEREAPSKLSEVKELIQHLANVKTEAIAFDTEDKNLNRRYGNVLDSVQFSYNPKKAYLIWVSHPETPFDPIEQKTIKKWLHLLFTRNNKNFKYWIAHNAQFDLAIINSLLKAHVANPIICTLTFAFLLEENYMDSLAGDYSLKTLSKRYGFKEYDAEALAARSEGHLRDLTREKFANYAMNDVCATIQLYYLFKKMAKGQGYLNKAMNLLSSFYSRVYKLLTSMEYTGIVVDIPKLEYLKSHESPINERIGEIINVDLKNSKAVQKTNELLVKGSSMTAPLFNIPWVFDIDKIDHRRLLYFYTLGLTPLQLPKINCLRCKGTKKIDIAGTEQICPKCKGTGILAGFDKEGYTTIARKKVKPGSMNKNFQDTYEDYPEVALYNEYNKLKKLKTSYIRSIEKFLDPKNGYEDYFTDQRIRPQFKLMAKTGRARSKNPNSQQIPRGDTPVKKAVKNLFCAPLGYAIVSLDYMAIEVRSWGILANDETMAELFIKAKHYRDLWRKTEDEKYLKLATMYGDIHVANASAMFGVSKERFLDPRCSKCKELKEPVENCPQCIAEKKMLKMMRQSSKALTFGSIYGRSLRSMAEQMDCTEEEALIRRNKAFSKFKQASEWLENIQKCARAHLYVESLLGRRRRLWELTPWVMFNGRERIYNFLFSKKFTNRALRQARNCIDYKTEILTKNGWKKYNEIQIGELALSKNIETGKLEWQPIEAIHHYPEYEGDIYDIKSRSFSSVCTPNHRWLVYNKSTKKNEMRDTSNLSVYGDHRIHRTGNYEAPLVSPWTDAEVGIIGWVLTDGSYRKHPKWNLNQIHINQTKEKNKPSIDACFIKAGVEFTKRDYPSKNPNNLYTETIWHFSGDLAERIRKSLPNKQLTVEFLLSLTAKQLEILKSIMMQGDGSIWRKSTKHSQNNCFQAPTEYEADMFQILLTLLGKSCVKAFIPPSKDEIKYPSVSNTIKPTKGIWVVREHIRKYTQIVKSQIKKDYRKEPIWCITIKNGTFVVRREGQTYITGNSPIQGFASDITFLGAALMHEEFTVKQKRDWRFFNAVHDAMYCYVPIPEVKECVLVSEAYFTDILFKKLKEEFNITIPFPLEAEYEIGVYGGDLIKWNFSKTHLDEIVKKLKEIDKKRREENSKKDKPYIFKGF